VVNVPGSGGEWLREVESILVGCQTENTLDRVVLRGRCSIEDVRLKLLSKTDNTTRATLNGDSDDWAFELVVDNAGSFHVSDLSELGTAYSDHYLEDALAAQSTANLEQLLNIFSSIFGDISIVVKVVWTNDLSMATAHYIDSVETFAVKATAATWYTFINDLSKGSSDLVIDDFDGFIECRSFRVYGPRSVVSQARLLSVCRPKVEDERLSLPSPDFFFPDGRMEGISKDSLVLQILHGVTVALTWYWLANSVRLGASGSDVYFSGDRIVHLSDFRPICRAESKDDAALAEWVFESEDPTKLKAVRRSASLALDDDDPLVNVAPKVRRTAESLFDIAKSDVIAEALATRRAARQAAISAAFDAARSAREAGVKAVERAIVQVAAGTAIVIANVKDFVNTTVTVLVLGLIGVSALLIREVSLKVEIRSISESFDAFESDLDEYGDTLSGSDLDSIKGLNIVTGVRIHLQRVRKTINAISFGIVSLVAATVCSLLLTSVNHQPVNPQKPIESQRASLPHQTPASSNVPASGLPLPSSGGQSR